MSYSSLVVSVLLIIVGVILILFPDYSKKKFFENSKNIRVTGVILLCIAILFAITDMRSVALYDILEAIYKTYQKSGCSEPNVSGSQSVDLSKPLTDDRR